MDLEENEDPKSPHRSIMVSWLHYHVVDMFYNVEHFTIKFGYTS